jgi:hypothetical protein
MALLLYLALDLVNRASYLNKVEQFSIVEPLLKRIEFLPYLLSVELLQIVFKVEKKLH